MVEDIKAFHQRFKLPGPQAPEFLGDKELFDFRVGFMREELEEFVEAYNRGDLPEAADALIDLVYVAMGTAYMMGLPWDELWNDVQRANMTKVRAEHPTHSKRGTTYDVVKPPGWVPPQSATIIERALAAFKRLQEMPVHKQVTLVD